MPHLRRAAAALTLATAITVAGLAGPATAWAHITVSAPTVPAGASDAAITFRVPDESETASTIGLKVQLPIDHPIAGVLVAPMPGWTARIVQTKLSTPIKTDDGDITQVVSEIDWTADAGSAIKPGYFGQFTIIGGKLPDGQHSLTFKAIQSYSDKTTVSWIEEAAPGSTVEPEHPAPVLQLAAADAAISPAATASSSSGTATTGVVLGVIGILLGGAALALTLLRGRRRQNTT